MPGSCRTAGSELDTFEALKRIGCQGYVSLQASNHPEGPVKSATQRHEISRPCCGAD